MKKIISLVLSLVLMLSFTACGSKTEAGWREQYDLGIKYINETKYEEAILAFTKALEIDPKQSAVYIALAEVYVRQGDYAAAYATLDKAVAEIGETDELTVARDKTARKEQGIPYVAYSERSDYSDGSYMLTEYDDKGKRVRESYYTADGTLGYYTIFEYKYEYYDDGSIRTDFEYALHYDGTGEYSDTAVDIQVYDKSGDQIWRNSAMTGGEIVECIRNDEEGAAPYSIKYSDSDGSYVLHEFYANSNLARETWHYSDGSELVEEYDESYNKTRRIWYNPDGSVQAREDY